MEDEETSKLVNTLKSMLLNSGNPFLLNTVGTAMEIVEEEETPLLNSVETVLQIKEDEETSKLVNTLKSTLQTLPPFPSECCIYRVPYELRSVNEEAYTPIVVSIGPFHHSKASLQEMEVQKQRYLNDFLKRKPDLDLEYYVRLLKKLEERARNCYAENIPYSSNDFITMMLLDGCFIVELFLKFFPWKPQNRDDPILKSQVICDGIRRDLVLLENQLPFFILEHLFSLIVGNELRTGYFFRLLTLNFLGEFICSGREKMALPESNYEAKHIVDLFLHCYTPDKINNSLTKIISIPNATRLNESGVKFTKPTGSSVNCLLDVKFTSGNLEIPPIEINDYTEAFLRNQIAYEQVDEGNTQYFSEYTFLMDCLIDSHKDVELLRNAGIVNSLLGSDEEVSQLFNKLGSGVVNGSHLYGQLCKDVTDYCNRPWHAWRAKLRRDYFNSPWTIISVFAAALLLILAIIEFVFSFIQFFGNVHSILHLKG